MDYQKGKEVMKKIQFLICILTLMLFSGCSSKKTDLSENNAQDPNKDETKLSSKKNESGYYDISAEEAKAIMDSETPYYLVDVRTKEEYEEKHIPGSILIPNEKIDKTLPFGLPKKETILLYCRSGNRSSEAAEKFAKMGYENVYEFGGINDWTYETETGAYVAPKLLTGEFKEFMALDIDGNQVSQDILRHYKLTVINVWGTFCSPCIREMPDLGELAEEYRAEGVQFIGIVMDVLDNNGEISESMLGSAKSIIDKTKADYLHLIPSYDLYKIKLSGVQAIPETIFVDSSGTILKSQLGAMVKKDWEKEIENLLEKINNTAAQ